MANDIIIILVTCASKTQAQKIARSLLTKKLVACANIISGVQSAFWWKGKINHKKETVVAIKTRKSNFKKIEREVKDLHSYEVPEIIALPIVYASRDYLNWVIDSTG